MIWAADVPIKATGPTGCAQRCMLQVLARRVGLNLRCIIGQFSLRESARLSEEPAANALRALEQEGLIARRTRYGPQPDTGKIVRLPDEYTLLIAENPLPAKADDDVPHEARSVTRKIGDTGPSVTPDLPLSNPGFPSDPSEIPGAEGGIEGGKKGGESAREFFGKIFAKLPDESRQSSSLNQMIGAWGKTDDKPSLEDLEAAAGAYAASSLSRKKPAHFWIIDGTFREFIPSKEGVWDPRLDSYRRSGAWRPDWGSLPGEEGCGCPDDVLAKFWRVPLMAWRRDGTWISSMWGPTPKEKGCRMPLAFLDAPPLPNPVRRDATGMPMLDYC